MNKTKIDWCDSTWNPVTGCYHGCEYCYARGIANRFSNGGDKMADDKVVVLDEKTYGQEDEKALAYPYGFKPTLYRYRLDEYQSKKGRNIFVCSMADLFGDWVPEEWIEDVFAACEKAPQHNYMFLTKNPERYVELAEKGILRSSDNMWYGWSLTKGQDQKRLAFPCSPHTFVSIEPILEPIKMPLEEWVIVGVETGRRKNKVVPERWWIEQIVEDCEKFGVPLFMKSSLADMPRLEQRS